MTEKWRVELHSHTLWSKDCVVSFGRIAARCAALGIDKIAITDHNTADGALEMQRLYPELVIVGEEIMTPQGELLGYFMKESIPAGLSPEETITRLRAQGAVISVSHPFDRLRKGAWEESDLARILPLVDAIEVFNARCMFAEDNTRALAFAQAHGAIGTAGSDAHSQVEYGRSGMLMDPFHTADEMRASLSTAQSIDRLSPWFVHVNSKTAKWSKKLGLVKRQWPGG
ncbi:MAG: PHP domain-containing protein [Pleurocapsa minor GSE-CHR-MK-17-07R]|jgi:predicted metal-dependent phosphoesterase TrpH|nr:PHP domain-containing protein [Pleurocapsa minor GSE-CHR-MK 17-07R]